MNSGTVHETIEQNAAHLRSVTQVSGSFCQWRFYGKINLLIRGSQSHSSNIPPGLRSGSNPHSPVGQQLHAAGVHVEFAGSFIVLHIRVLSALRHSHSGLSCFLMIRSRTFFDGSKGFVLFSEEYKKSEPFSYRKKVRILLLWCTSRDSNPGPTD